MKRKQVSLYFFLGVVLFVGACSPSIMLSGGDVTVDDSPLPEFANIQPLKNTGWYKLSQSWNEDVRRAFWFSPQGSRMMPYDWFLHLEMPDSTEKFRSERHMTALGYLKGPKDPVWNPDGLPIGFARSPSPSNGSGFVGPTCAACHTSLLVLGGKPVLIEGAPTLSDYQKMVTTLVNAMYATDEGEEKDKDGLTKFDRFAKLVLGNAYSADRAEELRSEFQRQLYSLELRNEINYKGLAEDKNQLYGKGRLDAVGAILNEVTVSKFGADGPNRVIADAPVSYPFLWGASQSDVVQWNGLADNQKFGFGPLGRNVGEVLGVFGYVKVTAPGKEDQSAIGFLKTISLGTVGEEKPTFLGGYESSVMVANLGTLEHWVKQLRAPKWPVKQLGELDPKKVDAGRKIYMGKTTKARCVSCHALVARADEDEPYQAKMVPVSKIGTDRKMASNFLLTKNPKTGAFWSSGNLEGTKSSIIIGDRYPKTMKRRGEALTTIAAGSMLAKPWQAIKAAVWGRSASEARGGNDDDPNRLNKYKARPLTGIWATAPYLHNGSVPNLRALLMPKERTETETFHVGSRIFDAKYVGLSTQEGPNTTLFDTSVVGNSNLGHSGLMQGSGLTDDQRDDLIEFLKSL